LLAVEIQLPDLDAQEYFVELERAVRRLEAERSTLEAIGAAALERLLSGSESDDPR
jgi:hypothetical protein